MRQKGTLAIEDTVIYEDGNVRIVETGRDYDFVVYLENKTRNDIRLVFPATDDFAGYGAESDKIEIPSNDWVGLCNFEIGVNWMQAFKQGDFTIEEASV